MIKRHLKTVIAGMAIGIANIIPGVSGGTMAVILGLYDQLISAINAMFSHPKHWRNHLIFLSLIGLGALLSIFLFSTLITLLIQAVPQPTYLFFIGLIIGSIPIVYKAHTQMQPSFGKTLLFLLSMGLIIWISIGFPGHGNGGELSTLDLNSNTLLFLGVSGFIAAAAMVIPGLSGSLILLLMGSYFIILEAISTTNLSVIAVVGVGAILGILTLSKGMNWCLTTHPAKSYYVILGLMVGSLVKLWPGLQLDWIGLISIISLGLGGFLALKLPNLCK
ncbi:DUF368 domain-containing protein [Candidatus Marinamargulisbacteria bacterium SCGC AG-439-L15]|nr:DUF368 domain-containing protein [Candidatus Marinamargulisbacteria bacterium SCGC AG-439-L15]